MFPKVAELTTWLYSLPDILTAPAHLPMEAPSFQEPQGWIKLFICPSKSTLIPITECLEHSSQFNHFPLCLCICLKFYENKNSPFKKQ